MQIDRRITNGLAWAGAALVVAIPVADFAIRQMSGPEAPQVAVVQEEAATPQPTPVAERPASPSTDAPAADPVETAATNVRPSGDGGAVDSFLQSGRELPSYITGGGSNTASAPKPAATPRPAATPPADQTTTATRPPVTTAPTNSAQPSGASQASLGNESSASVTRTRVVTLPTPVSMRPAAMASVQPLPSAQPVPSARPVPSTSQPPLVIDNPMPVVPDRSGGVVTAQDLDDWESGPLSEFLANRNGSGANYAPPPRSNYDPNGFFLDQGPNNGRGEQVYDEEFYFPFAQ